MTYDCLTLLCPSCKKFTLSLGTTTGAECSCGHVLCKSDVLYWLSTTGRGYI